MKLSTKGRYGLRAMVDLAIHSANEHVSIRSIAERQQISENYLEQVFAILRKRGLVKSIKGSQGGYVLAADVVNIKVSDILEAMEGSLKIVDTGDESVVENNIVEKVIATQVWGKINECISSVTDSITLHDLVEKYKKLNINQSYMFYI